MAKFTAISGPTGIGKTSFAIELAINTGAKIISFDSRQIYKELNIGVARPSEDELSQVKHHLIAFQSIHEPYNAQDFVNDVDLILQNSKNQNFILVGGTGFYLKALEFGLDDLPSISDTTRSEIQNEFDEKGIEFLQNEVKKIDPKSYDSIHIDNPRRLQRVIETWREHGLIYSELTTNNTDKKHDIDHIILEMPREKLYDRINRRVDIMIEQGLVEEVNSLQSLKHLKALETVGYAELFDYFDNKMTLKEAIDKIKQHTRNYAKRQMTWNNKFINSRAKIVKL
jgi:tRNA dimethylallyltransferase